jgi:diguanylate cyclase (GGDEF)-like protein
LVARAPADVLDALASELARALPSAAAESLAPDLPAAADVVATARTREEAGRLLVPLAWGGDVHRVVALTRPPGIPWAPDDVMLAETLVNLAALGLARLDSERLRAAQDGRDKALARAAHALNVSHALQEVLDTLAREADAAVAGSVAGFHLVEEDGAGLATAGHRMPAGWFGGRLAPGAGIAGRVLATAVAAVEPAPADEPALPPLPGLRTVAAVPLRETGELRGVLTVGFAEDRVVGAEDLQVLEAIADLAVVACHNAAAYDDIRTAASTDALTGLLNHGAMQVRVREEVARAARDGQPLCCVLIDLDDFKRVNDERGHPAGDALLRRVADALRAEVRPYDHLARYGGDEFVIVLPGTSEAAARAVAERVRARVHAGTPGEAGSDCSIGVSAWDAAMDADALLAAADRALLLAKRTGKGRVAVADPDAEEELARLRGAELSPAAVHALALAIDARDDAALGSAEQVVGLATRVAMLLGMTADAVDRIANGALLHDVGKLAIPDAILRKDGTLDDDEWGIMAEHPVIGEEILRDLPGLAPLAPIVRHEHEHWDGSGYPDGLEGPRIPMGSRIILACDAYIAMITRRPYRRELSQDAAVAELRARAGSQFDPEVVTALLDVLGAGG